VRTFRSTSAQLADLESAKGMHPLLLRFADGSTRSIKVAADYHLKLFADAASRLRAFPPPMPSGEFPPAPAEPQTASDELLDLMGAAESVEGERATFLQTIHAMAKEFRERKLERTQR
jgi:hypothetical protein